MTLSPQRSNTRNCGNVRRPKTQPYPWRKANILFCHPLLFFLPPLFTKKPSLELDNKVLFSVKSGCERKDGRMHTCVKNINFVQFLGPLFHIFDWIRLQSESSSVRPDFESSFRTSGRMNDNSVTCQNYYADGIFVGFCFVVAQSILLFLVVNFREVRTRTWVTNQRRCLLAAIPGPCFNK